MRGCNAPVVVGGIIPAQHIQRLKDAGVAAVLTPGAPADQVVAVVRQVLDDAAVALVTPVEAARARTRRSAP